MQFSYETTKKIISRAAQLIVCKTSMQNCNMAKYNIYKESHFLIKVKCLTQQQYNEVLYGCREVMVHKACSPDVRKHVCGDIKGFSVKSWKLWGKNDRSQ